MPKEETPPAAPFPGQPTYPAAPGFPGYPQPGFAPPGFAPQPGFPPAGNPFAQMMQMMQLMQASMGMPAPTMPALGDPAAQPFATPAAPPEDQEKGLDADIVQPALLKDIVREQKPFSCQPVLDRLCLTSDGKRALGGIPAGCTAALVGPPGRGKTRSMLEAIARAAGRGVKSALVVAEEGFRDDAASGRDDLCSRFVKIAMGALGADEAKVARDVLPNVRVILSQYHRGHTWDDFIHRYRYVVEKEGCRFVVVDSLNALDPTRARTADHLAVLKTYNHDKGVTCMTVGQIRDTGEPAGGEALIHTADVAFLIEEMSLGSKEQAEFWGGKYRDRIVTIRALKSVTTPIFPHPVRLGTSQIGTFAVHEGQPKELALPPV